MNGVINMITRNARSTQGGVLVVGGGNNERGFASLRYGGKLGNEAWYRVHTKHADYASNVTSSGSDAGDAWRDTRGGLRIDWKPSARDALTVIANANRERVDEIEVLPSANVPYSRLTPFVFHTAAEDVLMRWRHSHRNGAETQVQVYFNRYNRPHLVYGESRTTVDAELQSRLRTGGRHELTWGGGYRHSRDEAGTGTGHLTVSPSAFGLDLFTAFAQDEVQLADGMVAVTAGAKVEHSELGGVALQPTARVLLEPVTRHLFWGSLSRAVRMPSRLDRDSRTWIATLSGLDSQANQFAASHARGIQGHQDGACLQIAGGVDETSDLLRTQDARSSVVRVVRVRDRIGWESTLQNAPKEETQGRNAIHDRADGQLAFV